jgi:predicted Rossmann-fold nucleotide-binding protein
MQCVIETATVTATAKRLAIGVMASASGDADEASVAEVIRLGRAVAQHGYVLVTGGCPGLPCAAARAPQAAGGLTIGILPGLSRQ